jgi:hypothetical protein
MRTIPSPAAAAESVVVTLGSSADLQDIRRNRASFDQFSPHRKVS